MVYSKMKCIILAVLKEVLGDNIFYGNGLTSLVAKSVHNVIEENKATVFGDYVKDPERYGVAEFDDNGNMTSIKEKSIWSISDSSCRTGC